MNAEADCYLLNPELAEMLRAHGFDCAEQDGYIVPEFHIPVRLFAEAYPRRHADNVIVSRFDVGVQFADGRELYECFGDIGQDLDEAFNRNLHSFSHGSLHPMLAAFNRLHDEDICQQETWQIGTHCYRAYLGDFISKNLNENCTIPRELPDVLTEIICRQNLQSDHHFVRFYYAHDQCQTLNTEFMIDNVNLETAEDELAALPWQAQDDFYSLRQFILLQKI